MAHATWLARHAATARIATGRDAADTAFRSSYRGRVTLPDQGVTATTDGDLPAEDRSAGAVLG